MNPNIHIKIARIATAVLLVSGLTFFTGCSKTEKKEVITPENITSLRVNVLGSTDLIEDETSSTKGAKLATTQATETAAPVKGELEEYKSFDAIVTVQEDASRAQKPESATRNKPGSKGRLAAVIAPGVQYRVLIYQNGTFLTSKLASSGTALDIEVAKGATYTWIAYSYNKDNSVTLPDVASTSAPTIPTGENNDLLYASGSITIPTTAGIIVTPLDITFAHKLRRIGIELNTEGMFADLTAAQITFAGNYFKKGTLDLLTGSLTGSSQAYATIPTSSTYEQAPGHGFNDRNVFYFYSTDPAAINNVQLTINSFSISLDNSTIRTFSTPATLAPFNIPAISALGKSQTAKVDLIESPITVAGSRWARANLYYHPTATHNRYRFHHMNAQTNMRNSYWPWHAATPDENVGTADPCKLVYPANTWKTPTPAQLVALTNTTPTYKTSAPRNINYAGTGASAPYPNGNTLTFPLNGNGAGLELLGVQLLPFSTPEYGTHVHLWSDDPTINLLNLLGVGVNYYSGRNENVIIFGEQHSAGMASTLITNINVPILNINVLSAGYKNIRCVRAN
jgi:hypothetical protein